MHLTRLRTVVRERLMGTHGVVVGEVGTQEPAQMGLIENEEVVQALAADGADHSFRKGVLPGRSGRGDHLPDSHGVEAPSEGLAVDRVSVQTAEG